MGTIRVKPGTFIEDGQEKPFVIRDPFTLRLVPDEGIEVSDTDFFWAKLLLDGDVVKVGATQDDKPNTGSRKLPPASFSEEKA